MPIISVFFGIIIRLYHGDHNPPHFHAIYGEYEAIIDIKTGKIIEGKIPLKAQKLIEEWRKLHISELNSGWLAASSMKMPKKIKGLE
jgi:hypothetical protein